jgi:hypothetical protein
VAVQSLGNFTLTLSKQLNVFDDLNSEAITLLQRNILESLLFAQKLILLSQVVTSTAVNSASFGITT